MANRAAPFTQADVTRALKGAIAAGLKVREVIATTEGVRLIFGEPVKTDEKENAFKRKFEQ